jgi:hypothetical protein
MADDTFRAMPSRPARDTTDGIMRITTILKIVGLLIVAVVVAIVAILFTIDPNDYKDDIQQAVKDATGRDFAIEGDIALDIGLTTALSVSNVRFANAPWGSEPAMLRANELAIQVAVLPLISGDVDVKGVVIRDADILLETDAQGRSNADFGAEAKPDEPATGADDTEIRIAINNVVIENATVTIRNAQEHSETVAFVSKLNASGRGADAPLDIDLAADLTVNGNQLPLALKGTVGAPAVLMAGNRPYPVDVAGTVLGFDFKARGSIDNPAEMTGIALALEASAKDLSGLKPFAGDGLPTAGPFSLKASVTGGGDKYGVDGLALKLGSSDIGGALSATLSGARPRLDGTLSASKIDLTELLPPDSDGGDRQGGTAPAGTGGGAAAGSSDKVFPGDPLPLDGLRAADAKLGIAVAELVGPNLRFNDVSVDIALDNGNLDVRPFGFVLSGSRFDGGVSVAARDAPARIAFKLETPKLDVGKMLEEQADIELLRGDATLDIDIKGRGNSVAAIMASLNGYSRVLMNKGEAKTESFDIIVGGLSSVLGTLFRSKSEWTVLNCLASDFEITDGIARSQVTLIDTELLTITGEGQVDLGKETLAMKMTPAPKSATINVSVPIRIGGTLASPTFTPDELATVRKLGSLLGFAVFPPAAIIGLAELGSGNPCVELARQGTKAPPQQQSDGPADSVGKAVEDAVKEPEKVIEGVGKGLRNLFGR